MRREIPEGEKMARKLGGAPSYRGVPVVIHAREQDGELVDEKGEVLTWPKGATVEVRLWHEAQRDWQADKQVGHHIPFLPRGTALVYGVRANRVRSFKGLFLNSKQAFEPLCTIDDFEPLRERWKKPDDFLWLRMVLLQNAWLNLRGDRLAKLTPVQVMVLGLDFEARSVNEAVTEIIKRTQPSRSSSVVNIFRHLVPLRAPLELLDAARASTVQQYRSGGGLIFEDEMVYLEDERRREAGR